MGERNGREGGIGERMGGWMGGRDGREGWGEGWGGGMGERDGGRDGKEGLEALFLGCLMNPLKLFFKSFEVFF